MSLVRPGTILLALAFLLASSSRVAVAQQPTSRATGYSKYEKETIKNALERLDLKIDPTAEGKTIERIDVVRLEVLEQRDPIPDEVLGVKTRKLLNSLHYTSRDYVIRREVLLDVGEPYSQVMADETARNMRARMPLQVSLVLIVPVTGSAPDKVGLLVISKDIWSLRLSYDLSVTPGGVENFVLVPQETNLFGYQHTASTRFQYQPETYTFGVGYKVPRFGYSWVGASAAASVTLNRRSGDPEGSAASISVGRGLYSTRAEWGYSADASYGVGVARRYVNAKVGVFDSQVTPTVRDNIPTQYRSRTATASVGITRSFGWGLKNNFSVTMNAATSAYEGIDLGVFDPGAVEDFNRRFVPVGETRVYPAFSWATFRNDYFRTIDINTLALQEDYRLGHDVSVTVYPVLKALGSTRDVSGITAKAAYAIPLGDGLVGASVSTFAENEKQEVTDGSVSGSFGAVTPRIGIGRIVMNTSFINRYRNYLRGRTFLGGDDRLRGYPSNFFFGKDAVYYNLEFRSTSIEIFKVQIGGVAFFDAGDAAQGFDMLNAKQSVGVGIRTLLPQLNRLVFRADLAFPMKRGPFPETGVPTKVDPVGFFFAFDQAFAP